MNTGIQDAHNLAWKLASVIEGVSPISILNSYELERSQVGIQFFNSWFHNIYGSLCITDFSDLVIVS